MPTTTTSIPASTHASPVTCNFKLKRAQWWSNCDSDSLTDISGCTFESLVAGTDGHCFAVLIQVGED
ncbi:hypothetical protein [Streptomyces sp. NRRL S-646]|uniref:hypothetical protein n=1 Tax=Streptomyces sp. NRRL S-646 TaxID=1463917 RepID=UPI0013315D3E|nr:hypothetical protein [Streptomyces sp. NRRL S-646]